MSGPFFSERDAPFECCLRSHGDRTVVPKISFSKCYQAVSPRWFRLHLVRVDATLRRSGRLGGFELLAWFYGGGAEARMRAPLDARL